MFSNIMDKIKNTFSKMFKKNEEKKPFAKPEGYKNSNTTGYIRLK